MSTQHPRTLPASHGRAQLSLIEHALSPLDHRLAFRRSLNFESGFSFTDKNRNRKHASVTVSAVRGLSANDDLYLWGLLGLALSQQDASPDFYATPYYCLKQLGILQPGKSGSEEFKQFRDAIRRIAGVRYECNAFYDPILHEHREVRFGFLSYSLPISQGESRAWRFAWDPIFWELCAASAGSLRFDLPTYRELSPAGRRLYLVLKKLFWRSSRSPSLDVRELAVNTLGFAASSPTKELKRKLHTVVDELMERGLVQPGPGQKNAKECFTKRGKGLFGLTLHRGPAFERATPATSPSPEDSPLFDPLKAIGFDYASITRIIAKYPPKLIRLWADITLAAVEQGRVSTSPPAFFQYYLQRAQESRTTPPDWWRESEKQRRCEEERQRQDREAQQTAPVTDDQRFRDYLAGEARQAFDRVMQQLKADLIKSGRSGSDAEEFARHHATVHFRHRFKTLTAHHPRST